MHKVIMDIQTVEEELLKILEPVFTLCPDENLKKRAFCDIMVLLNKARLQAVIDIKGDSLCLVPTHDVA